jgi:hypothetical protein
LASSWAIVFMKLKWNCFGVSPTVRCRLAGLRSTGKVARIMAGGRRSTPLTGAGEIATPAAPSPRSSNSSVTNPPKE